MRSLIMHLSDDGLTLLKVEYADLSIDGSVEIPADVTKIGTGAFQYCKRLKTLELPEGIEEIGDDAFCGCENLKVVIIPAGVTKIGRYSFQNCKSLELLKLPDGIKEIGECAFYGCENLKVVIIPASMAKIGAGAFHSCKSLETINLPDGIREIEDAVFYGCESLKEWIIPTCVTKISFTAFRYCKRLATLKLPDGLIEIEEGAFEGCENLTVLMIPTSVMEIDAEAFKGSDKLFVIIDDSNAAEFERVKALLPVGLQTKVITKSHYDKAVSIREAELGHFCPKVDISAIRGIKVKVWRKGKLKEERLYDDLVREISSYEGRRPYFALKEALEAISLTALDVYEDKVKKTLNHHICLERNRACARRLRLYISSLEEIVRANTDDAPRFFKDAPPPNQKGKIHARYHVAQKLVAYLESNTEEKLALSEDEKAVILSSRIPRYMPDDLKEEFGLVETMTQVPTHHPGEPLKIDHR